VSYPNSRDPSSAFVARCPEVHSEHVTTTSSTERPESSESSTVGIIDWDMAGPGSPDWDLALFAWSFTPLLVPEHARQLAAPTDAGRRLRLICGTYGLEDRSRFIDSVRERMDASIVGVRERADRGEAEFQAPILGGHLDRMKRDSEYAKLRASDWQRAIDRCLAVHVRCFGRCANIGARKRSRGWRRTTRLWPSTHC